MIKKQSTELGEDSMKSALHHLFIFLITVLIFTHEISAQTTDSCTLVESGGILTVEMESADLTDTYWIKKNEIADYTGSGYLEYTGGTKTGIAGHSLLQYTFRITEPGRYSFKGRAYGLGHAANDIWARFPKGGVMTQYNGDSTGVKNDEWFKFMVGPEGSWYYFMKTQHPETGEQLHDVYVDFPELGVYTVEFSGRATDFKIDRFTLFNTSGYYGMDLNNPESVRENCSTISLTSPYITGAIPDQKAVPGESFNYTFPANTFAHAEGKSMYYFADLKGEPLPSWLSFSSETRTFTGTPSDTDEGLYYVVIRAQDTDGEYAVTGFNLSVTANNPPVIASDGLEDQNGFEGQEFLYILSPEIFTDPENDPLTVSAYLEGENALPEWLVFDDISLEFTGLPDINSIGKHTIVIQADDGNGGQATDTFTLTINQVTGITSGAGKNASVYPNPVDRVLTVKYKIESEAKATIYSLTGDIVYESLFYSKSEEMKIDLGSLDLRPGVYLVMITGEHPAETFIRAFYKK